MNRPRRRLAPTRPYLEILEDRTLLAAKLLPADLFLQSVGFAAPDRPLEYLEPPPPDFPVVRQPAPITPDSFAAFLAFGESEPNDTRATANPVPLGFDPGEDPVIDVSGTLPGGDLLSGAQNVDGPGWNLNTNANIANATSVPHRTILGSGDGTFDYYAFTATAGAQATFDIDAENFDTELFLYDVNGNLLAQNDDVFNSDPGDGFTGLASRITFTFGAAGTYIIGVGEYDSFSVGGRIAGNTPDPGDIYTLHLSVQNHATSAGTDPILESEPNHPISLDDDFFAVDLGPGDVFAASALGGATHLTFYAPDGTELIGSDQDLTFIHPLSSPLPGGGNAALSYVISTPGTYTIAVDDGGGDYTLELRVFRPVLEQEPAGTTQTIFLDFNGAFINPAIFGGPNTTRFLSPLSAFLPNWGLTAGDQDAVIDAVVAAFERSFSADIRANGANGDFDATGIPGQFDVEILNSRDHPDPFGQPNVSRVIIGGTIPQLGISTIGIAESIDVGNFDTSETGVVLLDVLSDPFGFASLNSIPLGPGASIIDLIGVAVGNIASHEAGHFSANWHTNPLNSVPNIQDQGGDLAGIIGLGPDGIFGTTDDIDVTFGVDVYVPNEGFTGNEDTRNAIAFGLASGAVLPVNDDFVNAIPIDPAAPQDSGGNAGATPETAEPDHAGAPPDNSVWWTWTAPATSTALITTRGSTFDTRLAVYTGSSLGGLSLVAENDNVNAPDDLTSEVTFLAAQGTVYRIAVDGAGGASGVVQLDIDLAPLGLALDVDAVDENLPAGTLVGAFQTADPDADDTFTYAFVPGPGDADNGAFRIVAGRLETTEVFDREAQDTYNVRVRTTDRLGLSFEQALTITVNDINEPTTALTLSNATLPENEPPGAVVGTFQAADPDIGETFTYALVPGLGSNDNAAFRINGADLEAVGSFNFEAKIPSVYRILVRVTDSGGFTVEQPFLITVTDVQEVPSELTLSGSFLFENEPAGTLVGTFRHTDPDLGGGITFALVPGPGGEDNARFAISGDRLLTAAPFDFEAQTSFFIRVRATDDAGLSVEQNFAITLGDLNEAPTDITLDAQAVAEGLPPGSAVGFLGALDPDGGEAFAFALVDGPGGQDNASFRILGRRLETTRPFDFEAQTSLSVRVQVTDRGGLSFVEVFTLNVLDGNDPPLDVTLTNAAVLERLPAGTAVGDLGALDEDPGEAFAFTLVAGEGDAGNPFFFLEGATLRTAGPLDFEATPTLTVRVRVTDLVGNAFEEVFVISVFDVNEAQTIGSFDPATATWYLRSASNAGPPDAGSFPFGAPGWSPVLGDWDGDEIDTVGAVDNTGSSDPTQAVWYLRNSNGPGAPDIAPFRFGLNGWIPVVGDWDGDGVTGIGMVDPTTGIWYLRNTPDAGPPDIAPFPFGLPGWVPVTGDWNGDGTHTIGAFDPATAIWYQRNDNSPGAPDIVPFAYGMPGWTPVVGDWEGNRTSTVGVVDEQGNWYLHIANTSGFPVTVRFPFGAGDWAPVAGTYSLPALRAPEVGPHAGLPPLDPGALGGVATAALSRLSAEGIDPATLDRLHAARLVVADLPGDTLGLADGASNTVWIDADAAGWGWFVDQTPWEDSEFASGQVQGMDLLSAVAHELGHLAGLEHSTDGDLMGETLRPGQRRLRALDAVFALGM